MNPSESEYDCPLCECGHVAASKAGTSRPHDHVHRDPRPERRCFVDMPIFFYNTLPALEEWQIRIMELRPSQRNTPLEARIFNANMILDGGVLESRTDLFHEYVAISYSWGIDQSPEYLLLCNDGVQLPIPIEAYRALHRVRDLDEPIYIWIDTICINQSDEMEKAMQIGKMHSIFQNATRVMVYLGEPDELTTSTLPDETEKQASTTFVLNHLIDYCITKISAVSLKGSTHWMKAGAESGGRLCNMHADLFEHGMDAICARQWFNRIWVKQELWAARTTEVRLGDSAPLTWPEFCLLPEYIELVARLLSDSRRASVSALAMSFAEKICTLSIGNPLQYAVTYMDDRPNPELVDDEEHSRDIVNLLRASTQVKSKLTHDRIFGLLGMSSVNIHDRERENPYNTFEISYQHSAVQVFAQLARYIIARDSSLNVLALRKETEHPVDDEDLPSWVPDWRHELGRVSFPTSNMASRKDWVLEPDIRGEDTELKLSGCILGVIRTATRHRSRGLMKIGWTHRLLDRTTDEMRFGPMTGQSSDLVAFVDGAQFNLLLRKMTGDKYRFIGLISMDPHEDTTGALPPRGKGSQALHDFCQSMKSEELRKKELQAIKLV